MLRFVFSLAIFAFVLSCSLEPPVSPPAGKATTAEGSVASDRSVLRQRISGGQNHDRKSSKVIQDCTICASCRWTGPCWTVPQKRENRIRMAGLPRPCRVYAEGPWEPPDRHRGRWSQSGALLARHIRSRTAPDLDERCILTPGWRRRIHVWIELSLPRRDSTWRAYGTDVSHAHRLKSRASVTATCSVANDYQHGS